MSDSSSKQTKSVIDQARFFTQRALELGRKKKNGVLDRTKTY